MLHVGYNRGGQSYSPRALAKGLNKLTTEKLIWGIYGWTPTVQAAQGAVGLAAATAQLRQIHIADLD